MNNGRPICICRHQISDLEYQTVSGLPKCKWDLINISWVPGNSLKKDCNSCSVKNYLRFSETKFWSVAIIYCVLWNWLCPISLLFSFSGLNRGCCCIHFDNTPHPRTVASTASQILPTCLNLPKCCWPYLKILSFSSPRGLRDLRMILGLCN